MPGKLLHDISQTLDGMTPLWPGEPPIRVDQHVEIADGNPVNVGSIFLPLHSGTHADAPLHYDAAGKSAAALDLEPYMGTCAVIDVRHAGASVLPGDCDWTLIEQARRVLFRTYDAFPRLRWDADFKAISPEVVARLGEMGVVLIGTDTPSLDPQNSKTMDAHKEVLASDMRILEGLVLDEVEAGLYELIALPLAIGSGDASPVRAVLREHN